MTTPATPSVPLEKARWSLAALWFAGAAAIFLLLVVMSIRQAFGERASEVWSWILPHLLPTLSLMVSVLASTAIETRERAEEEPVVHRGFHRLTLGVSGFYLALLVFAIVSAPIAEKLRGGGDEPAGIFAPSSDKPSEKTRSPYTIVEAMKESNVWLGPLQGVAVLCIGTLFFQRKSGKPAPPEKTGAKEPKEAEAE